ncbi:MAG: hypothetical protein HND48_04355 [Chloroflexi bacterium]|nr:hypothetical protein [Chloroflexota bacterium]
MHFGIGLFGILTTLLAGAAVGRLFGLSVGEGLYLTALALAGGSLADWTVFAP